MTARKEKRSLSAFGKSMFERESDPVKNEANIDALLKQIQTIDVGKVKKSFAIPDVIDRLLSKDEQRPVRSRKRSTRAEQRSARQIRQVQKIVSPLDNIPSAAHYTPNFDAVLSSAPKLAFQRAEMGEKRVSLDNCTMNEMMTKWASSIRTVEIEGQKPKNDPILPQTQPGTPKKMTASGVISSNATRDSFLRREQTPGPTDYNVSAPKDKVKMVTTFDQQPSRPPQAHSHHVIRDVRSDIDYTKPRAPRCIAFDKQSSRNPVKKVDDAIWEEIEEEQKRIIESMQKPEKKKPPQQKKKQGFALQTGRPSTPFEHIMRKEVEPEVEYDVAKSRRALDRPVTSFNIRQPALGRDRMVYSKSEAPDVMYDNVNDQFLKTVSRATTPLGMDREVKRRSPYHYMPKPCGAGDYPDAHSTVTGKRSIEIGKMAKRKCMLDTPGSFKRKTNYSIPVD